MKAKTFTNKLDIKKNYCLKDNNIDKLRAFSYFSKTVEYGSFSKAAKKFNVPASSVSRRIADLEAELGAQLLVRTTRSVVLTELGKQYLEQVESVLQQVHQSEQMVRNYQSKPTGTLKISSMVSIGEQLILPILDEFSLRYPDITIDIVLSDELSKVRNDDVDIAIRGGYAPDERIVALRLMDNDFIAVASPSYLKRYGCPASTADLVNHRGLFFKTPMGPTPWLSEVHGQWQNVTGKMIAISNNGNWLLRKAIAGEGIIMLPQWVLMPSLKQGLLQRLEFEQPLQVTQNKGLGIFMLYQKLDYTNPKIKVAIDFIAERIKGFCSATRI